MTAPIIGPMGRKLQAIQRLRLTDGISWTDAHDIALWANLAGRLYETAQFSDLTLERINQIFDHYFAGE